MAEKADIHAEVTNAIVKMIEEGAPRFEMPWHRAATGGTPVNATTKKKYHGINTLSLWVSALQNGFETPEWATYKQWQAAGAQVRKGQKSSLVIFYKTYGGEDDDARPESEKAAPRRIVARASRVFNASQVDGYVSATQPADERPNTIFDRLTHAESVIAATGATILFGGSRACYRRQEDDILIPEARDFIGSSTSSPREAFYSTIFHELAHWTGAEHRLNRVKGKRFADRSYAFEELIAEISAAASCAEFGISCVPRPDHAAYVQSWLKALKDDHRLIFTAAAAASAATSYIADLHKAASEPTAIAA